MKLNLHAREQAAKRWDEAALALDQGRDGSETLAEMIFASPQAGRTWEKLEATAIPLAARIRALWPLLKSHPSLALVREDALDRDKRSLARSTRYGSRVGWEVWDGHVLLHLEEERGGDDE